jgi:hypothetical protein
VAPAVPSSCGVGPSRVASTLRGPLNSLASTGMSAGGAPIGYRHSAPAYTYSRPRSSASASGSSTGRR